MLEKRLCAGGCGVVLGSMGDAVFCGEVLGGVSGNSDISLFLQPLEPPNALINSLSA